MARTTALRALRHHQFAVFWIFGLISNSANWIQNLMLGFVLFEFTGSNTWLGVNGVATLLPAVLLGPFSGVLADRVPRRLILIGTLSAQTLAAFALWALWVTGDLNEWWIVSISLFSGIAAGLQIPSWQSFVPLLVPRNDLLPAVRLNSMQFTASRAIGPGIGIGLLASVGPGAAFIANAVTYFGVLGSVIASNPRVTSPPPGERLLGKLREGLVYVRRRKPLLMAVSASFAISFFGQSLLQLAAGLAEQVYDVDEAGLAGIVTAAGVGSVVASLVLIRSGDVIPRSTMSLIGLAIYGTGVTVIGISDLYVLGLAGFFLAGSAHVTTAVGLNTTVQIQVPEEIRGRVMSIYLLGVFGGIPLGSLVGGRLGDVFGLRPTIFAYGMCLFAYLAFALTFMGRLRRFDADYDVLEEAEG